MIPEGLKMKWKLKMKLNEYNKPGFQEFLECDPV